MAEFHVCGLRTGLSQMLVVELAVNPVISGRGCR